jgi:hypothetical protein
MTLANMLQQKLSDWHPPGGREALAFTDEASGWAVAIQADRNDVLGCLVWELELRRTRDPGPAASVRAWADRVAARVTGLLEPLKLIEVDTERDEAMLRSEAPSPKGDKLHYYELRLRGTRHAVARRFQTTRDAEKREQVPFALTHEALAKLVADLTS